MDGSECEYEDCRALVVTLGSRIARHGCTNWPSIKAEIKALIDLVEAVGMRDPRFLKTLHTARPLLALRRQAEALDHVDLLLSAVKQNRNRRRPWG